MFAVCPEEDTTSGDFLNLSDGMNTHKSRYKMIVNFSTRLVLNIKRKQRIHNKNHKMIHMKNAVDTIMKRFNSCIKLQIEIFNCIY